MSGHVGECRIAPRAAVSRSGSASPPTLRGVAWTGSTRAGLDRATGRPKLRISVACIRRFANGDRRKTCEDRDIDALAAIYVDAARAGWAHMLGASNLQALEPPVARLRAEFA